MQIIIDGYNLLLRTRRGGGGLGTSELERMRDALTQKIAAYTANRSIAATIVFDGQQGVPLQASALPGRVKVLFSRPPENADALIKRLVQAARQPRDIIVVTSDQPLARFIRSCGCQLLSVEEWREKMERGRDQDLQEKHGRLNDLDLEEWLRLFGE